MSKLEIRNLKLSNTFKSLRFFQFPSKYSYKPVVPRNRSLEGDISFHFTLQPLVFLRPLTWGMSCPLCIRLTLRSGDAVSLTAKAGKTTGLPLNCSKKYPLPVNGCHPRPAAGAVCLLQGFDRGPDCTASPVCDE